MAGVAAGPTVVDRNLKDPFLYLKTKKEPHTGQNYDKLKVVIIESMKIF